MRILHVQTGGGSSGGIANYIANLVRSEALREFEFVVAAGIGESDILNQNKKYSAARVVEVSSTYGLLDLPKMLTDMRRLLRQQNITLVHSHALRAGFICAAMNLLFKVQFVHTNHGLRFVQKSRLVSSWVFRLLERFVVSRAERVFCVRNSDARLIRKVLPCYSHKIETIVTRIDPIKTLYDRGFRIEAEPMRLIGIGSIIDVKRVDRFIDWLAALSLLGIEYSAVWLGDGPLRAVMEERAKNSSVKLKWLGHVDAVIVAEELSKADVMLLTSDFEVLPLAALEAMANGKPIVATNFFGVNDFILNDITGFILSPSISSCQVAEKIAVLASDKNLRNSMGNKARRLFLDKFFGVEHMGSEYAIQYKAIFGVR